MNNPTTPKEEALAAISALPEGATREDIACRLHPLQRVHEGLADIEAGRTVSHEHAKARLAKWHVG